MTPPARPPSTTRRVSTCTTTPQSEVRAPTRFPRGTRLNRLHHERFPRYFSASAPGAARENHIDDCLAELSWPGRFFCPEAKLTT